ncbi:MAG: hypothetical protein ACRC1F_00900 [Metamycoplasmataceae bacterium]
MKIKKILLTSISAPIFPILLLSSCSAPGPNTPVRLNKFVFETGNKTGFNDLFNLLNNQTDNNSFISKTADEINKIISEEIEKNSLIQEKLRIYFFSSIFNSLNSIVDINDENNIFNVTLIGERLKGVDEIKRIIDDSIKPDPNNSKWKKYDSLEEELKKITDMKISLSYKRVDDLQSKWTWVTSFKLSEDSELRKLLKIQNDNGDGQYVNESIFYRRQISNDEREGAKLDSFVDGVFDEAEFRSKLRQLEYQSSKWYWDEKEQVLTSIEKESNLNPYSTDGTSGGFTESDAKRTKFAIDFEQHGSNVKLYRPVFLLQSNSVINSTFINSEWDRYLIHKGYKNGSGSSQDPKKVQDIRINLKSSYVEYNKKI